eukprot:COSAG06_NODE_98_length_24155_cov_29.681784_10_plen_496_part_00
MPAAAIPGAFKISQFSTAPYPVSHAQSPKGLTQVPWSPQSKTKQRSLRHSPAPTSQTSGDASVIAAGPSTITDPVCVPVQSGNVPSHGNGSLLPSALVSCESLTVRLPPSETDTIVMLSSTLLRKITPVTVTDPPDSIVSGTGDPSLCSSHRDALKVAAVMLSGELTSMLEPSITAEPLLSQCELLSDGSTVPLTVESGGSVTVTGVVFRSSVGDITAVSLSDGGSLTVGDSQLIAADGSSDPFPCDGTLPDCTGAHVGSVVVDGPSVINMASPLVCDVGTGECLSDICLTELVDCGSHGACVSPLGTCDCSGGWGGDHCGCPPGAEAPESGLWYCGALVGQCTGPGHANCDPFDETVSIARNELGYTFGGYAQRSWGTTICCGDSVQQYSCGTSCGGQPCCYENTAATDFIFLLSPEVSTRFDPIGAQNQYQRPHPDYWPDWGSGGDLRMGQSGPPGTGAHCSQGDDYAGNHNEVCGGNVGSWGETRLVVYYPE